MKINDKIKAAAKETREVDFFKQHTHKTSLFRFFLSHRNTNDHIIISGQPQDTNSFLALMQIAQIYFLIQTLM